MIVTTGIVPILMVFTIAVNTDTAMSGISRVGLNQVLAATGGPTSHHNEA